MSAVSKVCVVGIWHLGSVVSACFADLGYRVIGVDSDPKRVRSLNKGVPPLFEPGLAELMTRNLESKRLSFTTELGSALKGVKYVFVTFDIRVDTMNEVDLPEIFRTSAELSEYLEDGSTIIVSSQVPVGTCEKIASIIRSQRPSLSFGIAYVPENLRLGQAIECFRHPDIIIIGSDSVTTQAKVEELLSVIQAPKMRMDLRSAEMTKHAINAYLAISISFVNEFANLCDEVGADAVKVAEAMRLDSRISPKAPLRPGLGFAGGTLDRDLEVLQKLGEKISYQTYLINSVLKVNQQQNRIVARKLRKIYGSLQNLKVGILGLTYKAGTSTLRRFASLEIIRDLINGGARVKAYDPKADPREVQIRGEFEFCSDPYAVASDCNALVFVTNWPEFKELDFSRIKSLMRKPVVIDAQNMLDSERMIHMGFVYLGVGRGFITAGKQTSPLNQLYNRIEDYLRISVLICTLNEEDNLPRVLPKIPWWVDEVILVDGHSTDNTVAVAKSILPTVRILYQPGRGKDDAIKHGFKNTTGEIIVTLDADGSTDPEQIPEFLHPLLAGYDFVKGSRFLKASPNMPLHRKIGNKMLVALTNLLFGTKYTDVCCGYNAFWKRCLDKIELSSDGFDYEPVLHVKIKKAGLRVAEVHCRDIGRIGGASKLPMLTQGLKAAKAILRQRLKSYITIKK